MKKRIATSILAVYVISASALIFSLCGQMKSDETVIDFEPEVILISDTRESESESEEEIPFIDEDSYLAEEMEQLISDEEVELIALVTMAEAEGECELGKRLVIDTILNRVDSVHFPDTIEEVIYQKNQFEAMWNGRVDRCSIDDDICQLVKEEIESRQDYDVIFFTAGKYSKYGKPMFRIENHYFSSYE